MTPCDREQCFMCKLEKTDSEESFRPTRTYKNSTATTTFLNASIIVVFVLFLISVYAKK